MADLVVGVVDVHVLCNGANGELQLLALRRAEGTRCTGAWEVVHGRIEPTERPEDAALREVLEETGLTVDRLYSVTCQPFYLHRTQTVQMAVAFAAFVPARSLPTLGAEHDAAEWLPISEATQRLTWPRSRSILAEIATLLRTGDAGPVEDVLRVR